VAYFVDAIPARQGVEGAAAHLGRLESLEEAVQATQRTVGNFLRTQFKVGMMEKMLFARYQERGLFPFIFLDDDQHTFNVRSFNHFPYALKRCAELCRPNAGG
jgi:hypothetical protein